MADTINPRSEHYNQRAASAKTVRIRERTDGLGRPSAQAEREACASATQKMSCIACHSSWNPSCFGCHLPQQANKKMPQLHNEGDITRNYVSYNFQTLRDDVFMLARDGDATANRIGPARSSCAIHVGSYNANRESIYVQQQTISGDGMSGIAFSTNVPHTVRGGPPLVHDPEHPLNPQNGRPPNAGAILPGHSTRPSRAPIATLQTSDNNAIMAQLLMQGTNYVNFIGRYCWVAAGEHGLAAVVVTERDEPQAVIGSSLHQLAFPDDFRKHLKPGATSNMPTNTPAVTSARAIHHRKPEVLSVQARGEYLYAACGETACGSSTSPSSTTKASPSES